MSNYSQPFYTYRQPRAPVTATVAVIAKYQGKMYVALGLRGSSAQAFPNTWCLPGGHLEVRREEHPGETVRECAVRELDEELGMLVDARRLKLVNEYSGPDIDPRGHYVSLFYVVDLGEVKKLTRLVAADDLQNASWRLLDMAATMDLAFNHSQMLGDLRSSMR